MVTSQVLSRREKFLASIAVVILIVFVAVGYTKAGDDSDLKNQQQHLRGQQDYVKNLRREVQDAKKEAKNQTVDTTAIDTSINAFDTCLQKLQMIMGTGDFWSTTSDCNSLSKDAEDIMNDVMRPLRDCNNSKRQIDERRREKKNNVDSGLKDILRNDKTADVSPLNALIVKIDAEFKKADQLNAVKCNRDVGDQYKDISAELNSLFQDWYSTQNDVNQKANSSRQLTDSKREFEKNIKPRCEKDKAREFKTLDKQFTKSQTKGGLITADQQSAFDKVKGIYTDQCTTLLKAMQQAVEKGDGDAFQDARSSFDEQDQDFWNTMNDLRNELNEQQNTASNLKNVGRDLKQRQKEIGRTKKRLSGMVKIYNKAVKKYVDATERKQTVEEFGTLVKDAEKMIAEIEGVLKKAEEEAPKDPESYWSDYMQDLNDMQSDFNELQNRVQSVGDVLNQLKDYGNQMKFIRESIDQLKKGQSKEVTDELEKLYGSMQSNLQKAWGVVVSDPEEARGLLEEINDLREQGAELVGEE